jgi:site-specific recombinase XerD
MPKTSDLRRRWRRLHEWPPSYRAAWLAATASGDDLDTPSYGRSLRPASLDTIARNFGRWLSFLDGRGELNDNIPPAQTVTPARVADYLRELKAMHYRPQSIVLAISAISCAMRIFAPEKDWHWIWKPNGVKLAAYLKGRRKEFPVPHPSELYLWGLELLTQADAEERPRNRLAQYRDGLIICLLAGRALRRRSFVAMQIDQNLIRRSDGWYIKFEPEDVKNRRWIEVAAPKTLEPWIDRYIGEIRPALLLRASGGGSAQRIAQATTALWLSSDGTALSAPGLTNALWNRSGRQFDLPFATHRFRHAVGTYAPVDDPEHPGIATSLLAIGARMHEKHYNRAQDHAAETNYHIALERERAKAVALARRLIGERQREKN